MCVRLAGLRIQRMPSEAGQEFGDPASYPYMTVASPSCHDTSTTRAWWEQDAGRRERFFYQARLPQLHIEDLCFSATWSVDTTLLSVVFVAHMYLCLSTLLAF